MTGKNGINRFFWSGDFGIRTDMLFQSNDRSSGILLRSIKRCRIERTQQVILVSTAVGMCNRQSIFNRGKFKRDPETVFPTVPTSLSP